MTRHRAWSCVGSFMMDLVVRAPGARSPARPWWAASFDVFLGGKGCNQAIAAARAGAATAMIGRLGPTTSARGSSTASRPRASTRRA